MYYNRRMEKIENLKSIILPLGLTYIGGGAFANCGSLEKIIIPDGVTSIGVSAFAYCSKLTIYCRIASIPDGWLFNWNYSNRPVVWGYRGN